MKIKSAVRFAGSSMEYIELVDREAYPSIIENAQEIRFKNYHTASIIGFGIAGFAVSLSLSEWISISYKETL